MALFDCPECGRQISDRAPACVGCGAPLPLRIGDTTLEQPSGYLKHLGRVIVDRSKPPRQRDTEATLVPNHCHKCGHDLFSEPLLPLYDDPIEVALEEMTWLLNPKKTISRLATRVKTRWDIEESGLPPLVCSKCQIICAWCPHCYYLSTIQVESGALNTQRKYETTYRCMWCTNEFIITQYSASKINSLGGGNTGGGFRKHVEEFFAKQHEKWERDSTYRNEPT